MVYFGNAYDNLGMYSAESQTEILFSLCGEKSKTGNFFVHFISNLQTFINSNRELQVSTDPRFCNYPLNGGRWVAAAVDEVSVVWPVGGGVSVGPAGALWDPEGQARVLRLGLTAKAQVGDSQLALRYLKGVGGVPDAIRAQITFGF